MEYKPTWRTISEANKMNNSQFKETIFNQIYITDKYIECNRQQQQQQNESRVRYIYTEIN